MVIFKLLQSFLMPSAFVFLFVAVGFLFLKKKKKIGQILLIGGAFFYYFFSITPISEFLLMSLEEKHRSLRVEDISRAEKVVLLLGGRESNILRSSEVLRIWHLADGKMKLIISGTDPLVATSEEANAVRNYFIYRGVDEGDIVIEGKSRNTRENVINVKEIVEEEEFFLVTSAYHMERAVIEFERLGARPIPAPTDFKRRRVTNYNIFDFVPNAQNLRNSDIALHEHLGVVYYRFVYLFNRGKG